MSQLEDIKARAENALLHENLDPSVYAELAWKAVVDVPKLVAALEAVEQLAEEWRYKGEFGWGAWQEGYGPDPEGHILDGASGDIRKAIAEALS